MGVFQSQDNQDMFQGGKETPLLVSKDERMRGVVRYRQHDQGNSLKIESDDPEIKESLEMHLSN